MNSTITPEDTGTTTQDGRHCRTLFSGSVWYHESHFLGGLQQEIDRARTTGSTLCLLLLRLPDYTRRAARQLFAHAEAEGGRSFFGILANGDYAIAMPGSGYTEGALERVALARALSDFGVCAGLAVLDEETSALQLLQVAANECSCDGMRHFENVRV